MNSGNLYESSLSQIDPLLCSEMGITAEQWIESAKRQLGTVGLDDWTLFEEMEPDMEELCENINKSIIFLFQQNFDSASEKLILPAGAIKIDPGDWQNKIETIPCSARIKSVLARKPLEENVLNFLNSILEIKNKRKITLKILRNSTKGDYYIEVARTAKTSKEFLSRLIDLFQRDSIDRAIRVTVDYFPGVKCLGFQNQYNAKFDSIISSLNETREMLNNDDFWRYFVLNTLKKAHYDQSIEQIITNTLTNCDRKYGVSEDLYKKTQHKLRIKINDLCHEQPNNVLVVATARKNISNSGKNHGKKQRIFNNIQKRVYYSLFSNKHDHNSNLILNTVPFGYDHYGLGNISKTCFISKLENVTKPSSLFILDTGANMHLCNNPNILSDIHSTNTQISLKGLTGSINSNKIGRILMSNKPQIGKIYLEDVLYVPSSEINILSVKKLADSNVLSWSYNKK